VKKDLIRRRSKGCGDGPQSSATFILFFKNNTFTAYFDLKFLLKNMFQITANCVGVSAVDSFSFRYATVSLPLNNVAVLCFKWKT